MIALFALTACSRGDVVAPLPSAETDLFGIAMVDHGLDAGVQGWLDGQFQRGRSCAPADFDGDGDLDLYAGSPMDLSTVWLNDTVPGEHPHFTLGQIVFDGVQAWGASAADADDDGDPDLYVAGGGNEEPAKNWFFLNDPEGAGGPLVDATEASGFVSRFADGTEFLNQSAGAQWADFDRDGRLDLFVSETVEDPLQLDGLVLEDLLALDQLWLAQDDGTWVDHGLAWGLVTQLGTRNSAFLDIDHDGWLDLYEHNTDGPSVLWRNTGAGFEDVTLRASLATTHLGLPVSGTWASIATDVNSDGWDDLLVMRRGLPPAGEPESHTNGHLLFLNVAGTGFVEVADFTHLNDNFVAFNHFTNGVMGCQAADLNADGYPDIVTGNGSPESGAVNGLFLTTGLLEVDVPGVGPLLLPQYLDATSLTDTPAPELQRVHATPEDAPADGAYPSYPYRTHGLCAADFDGDGYLEVFEANGGPGRYRGEGMVRQMQEPDRLWKVDFLDAPPHWISVLLRGGGGVARDAIGARVAVTASDGEASRTLHQTRFSGSGFAAGNGPELFFGLGADDRVDDLVVVWPDDTVERFDPPSVDAKIVVVRGAGTVVIAPPESPQP